MKKTAPSPVSDPQTKSRRIASERIAQPASMKNRSLPKGNVTLSMTKAISGSITPSKTRVTVRMIPATATAMP